MTTMNRSGGWKQADRERTEALNRLAEAVENLPSALVREVLAAFEDDK